jgi:nitrite reductase/ring-hydroxylating ferredoxin subunit
MLDMNRRDFLVTAATTAAVLSLPVLQSAEAFAADAPPAAGGAVDVGALKSFDKDGVTDAFAAKTKGGFLIIRHDGKIYASSSICTHKGCVVQKRADDLYCKCHRSAFNLDGSATAGPAQRTGSLLRYAISTDANGHVRVDKSKQFYDKDWNDPASFIKVDGTA